MKTQTPSLVQDRDLEDFESCDALYLSKFANLSETSADGLIRPQTQIWFKKHPKEYLRYLIAGPDGCGPTYRETQQGVAALSKTIIRSLLSTPATQPPDFARSLIYDLADALDQPVTDGDRHPATSRQADPDRLLRNI